MKDTWISTIQELKEEEYISSMSQTEKELYFLRQDLFNGKVKRYNAEGYDPNHTCYEDAVGCVLFWAREDGKISEGEYKQLSEKYA